MKLHLKAVDDFARALMSVDQWKREAARLILDLQRELMDQRSTVDTQAIRIAALEEENRKLRTSLEDAADNAREDWDRWGADND